MTTIDPYNPLDLEALGDSLLRELERRALEPLASVRSFDGTGIYALYYFGSEAPYSALGSFNREHETPIPIYVGRSQDPGARQGLNPFVAVKKPLLWNRIKEHKRNIESASGIDIGDFRARSLVAMPIWIPLAEAMAIRRYRPVWNSQLQGFGIHAPGKGRKDQQRSAWDELHPGRGFAVNLRQNDQGRKALLARTQAACEGVVRDAQKQLELRAPQTLDSDEPRTPQPSRGRPGRRSRSDA